MLDSFFEGYKTNEGVLDSFNVDTVYAKRQTLVTMKMMGCSARG
jgi:hypothetical protein